MYEKASEVWSSRVVLQLPLLRPEVMEFKNDKELNN